MEQVLIPKEQPKVAGNMNTGFLKLVALFFMVIDHTGAIFFPRVMELRLLGRIAFPLFIWCGVVGCEYTHNHFRYLLRLFLFALISQPFFMFALNHRLEQLNVFATIFLGQLALFGIKKKWYLSQVWLPAICILLSCMIYMDYGWKGVSLFILMYMARKTRTGLAATLVAFCFFWGEGTRVLTSICGISVKELQTLLPFSDNLYTAIFRLENFAVLSLPLIVLPAGSGFRINKWVSYTAYPLHLCILWLMKSDAGRITTNLQGLFDQIRSLFVH